MQKRRVLTILIQHGGGEYIYTIDRHATYDNKNMAQQARSEHFDRRTERQRVEVEVADGGEGGKNGGTDEGDRVYTCTWELECTYVRGN